MTQLQNIVFQTPSIHTTPQTDMRYIVTRERSGYFIWEVTKTASFEKVAYKHSFCSKFLLDWFSVFNLRYQSDATLKALHYYTLRGGNIVAEAEKLL